MEKVIEIFIEKQRERLADGQIRQEEYEAILDGANDALSYVGMSYMNSSETVEKSTRSAVPFNEIEEKYKKFREVSLYKNSFLRVSDMIKHAGQRPEPLEKITQIVRDEL